MEYVIDTSSKNGINWSAKGVDRILQNILNLISTWKYEVAYNRIMGIDTSILDKPLNEAVTLYISEIYRIIPVYEPRATVKEVQFTGADDDGNLSFKVVVEI